MTSGDRLAPKVQPLRLQRFRPLSNAPQSSQQHRQCCGSRPQALRGHILTILNLLAAGGPQNAEVSLRPSREMWEARMRLETETRGGVI